jgi:hypothetical protein
MFAGQDLSNTMRIGLNFDTYQRFLSSLTGSSRAILFAAIFCLFGTFGFLTDIMSVGRHSGVHVLFDVMFTGVMAALTAFATAKKRWLLWPLMVAQLAVAVTIAALAPTIFGDGPMLTGEILRLRLTLDAVGSMVTVIGGYIALAIFLGRESANYLRIHAEIVLAHEIHQALVPPLAGRTARFEFAGASHPSGEVGGDLVDVVDSAEGRWIAYVADVSGHGVHAGVVMGLVKSAARMALHRHASLEELLRDLNDVLMPLMRSNMFVTIAAVESTPGGIRFSLAGHLPILHFRADLSTVEEVSIANLPIGFFPDQAYSTGVVRCRPGDVLVLITDGLVEVFDRHDRELGLDAIKRVLVDAGRHAPAEILAALRETARAHGAQLDDQSALVLRVLEI